MADQEQDERKLNIPKQRSKVVRGGQVLPPTDRNSFDKFYREYVEEEKKAKKQRISFSDTVTALEVELLDIVEKVRYSIDYKQSDIQVKRLKALESAFIRGKYGRKQTDYLKKQFQKTRELVNKERRTLVGDVVKKTRKAADDQLKRSTKAVAKGLKAGISSGVAGATSGIKSGISKVGSIIDDEISDAIGNDRLLSEAYRASKKGISVLGGIAAKPLKAIGNRIMPGIKGRGSSFAGDIRGSVSRRSFGMESEPQKETAVEGPAVVSELAVHTDILKTHTSLLEKISKESSKSSKAVDKATKLAEKADRDRKRGEFTQEETEQEARKGPESSSGGFFGTAGKAGIFGKLFGTKKAQDVPGEGGEPGIIDKTRGWIDTISDTLVGGYALKGILGKKIPGLGLIKKIPGMGMLGNLLGKGKGLIGAGLSKVPGIARAAGVAGLSGLGSAGKFLFSKAGGTLLYGADQAYNAYDAISNRGEKAKERGTSEFSSVTSDLLHGLSLGAGSLVASREETAQQLDVIGTKIEDQYSSIKTDFDKGLGIISDKFSGLFGDKTQSEREADIAKMAENSEELSKLKERLKQTSPSETESVKQQESRIRDLEEENQRLQNKWLKEEMIKRDKAAEDDALKQQEQKKSWFQRTSDFLGNAYQGVKEKLGFGKPMPDVSSIPGSISYKPTTAKGEANIQKEFEKLGPELRSQVEAMAKKYNLDPALVYSVVGQESGGNPDAVSPTGVRGPMQVTQKLARSYGLDRDDPKQNIEAGTRFLSELATKFNGDLDQMLAYYNGGDEYAKRAKSGRNYTIDPKKDSENDSHFRGIMNRLSKYKKILEEDTVTATGEALVEDRDKVKANTEEKLAKLSSDQSSDQQKMFGKMKQQGMKRDIDEARSQGGNGGGMGPVIAPASSSVINNNYNSSVVQSNLRHTESSFVREQEKMWSVA